MTKAHYARSITLECELEQVKKQRDDLLEAAMVLLLVADLSRVEPGERMQIRQAIQSVESTKGE